MTLFDITSPIENSLAVWPGDTPFHLEWNGRLTQGASVNLSAVTMSLHTGTHADAPYHYSERGATMEQVRLDVYVGPAVVVDMMGRETITAADLGEIDFRRTPRLLLRTGAWPDRSRFPSHIPTLTPEVPAYLGARGVVLIGLDVPSVDALDSKDLPNHHALGANAIAILESLALEGVAPGEYELIALPLRLAGADGSPVRAILRR